MKALLFACAMLIAASAAAQPLSIQAHPSRDQAIDGYARDEADGIPRDAADRNYKDAWPKPEILIALEPFDALVGFRPLHSTVALLDALAPEGFDELTDLLRNGKLRDAFTQFMSSDRRRPAISTPGRRLRWSGRRCSACARSSRTTPAYLRRCC